MKRTKEYTISFAGLNSGKHDFSFSAGKSFFESFAYGEIKNGDIKVNLCLFKESNMMRLEFGFSGYANIQCDRCADMFDLNVKGSNRQIVKFDIQKTEANEEIFIVESSESEIDLSHYIYESIHLLLPQKRLHPGGKCNKTAVRKLAELTGEKKFKNGDPRWAALKGIKL